MKPYSLEIIDASTILDELFRRPEDDASREQIMDEMTIAEWTYGTNAYSLIHIDGFMEFLMDCVDNEICQGLTRDKIEQMWHPFQWEIQSKIENGKGVDVYVNLEMQ